MDRGERLNGYTHAAGAVLALAGSAALLAQAAARADPWRIAAFAIYGATLVMLYLVSTLYHASRGRAKEILRKLDYVAIYLFIAGSYTPFALVSLDVAAGRSLLAAVWSLAAVGIVQELWVARGARWTSLAIYLLMGWAGVAALEPLAAALTADGLAWLLAGGATYTLGVLFYLLDDRVRHGHGIWHLFVMGGSAAHFTALARFVA